MLDLLSYDFMQRALVAAVLVGLVAPLVGIFLIQRRLSLIGDGMGHVALAGVAIGLLTNTSPVWAALVLAVAAAVVVELIRAGGRTSGDVALALIFYGGIALGVVIIAKAPGGTPANLTAYLFGAITTVRPDDLWVFAALALVVLLGTWLLRPRLFAVANDEEHARASGMPVLPLNIAVGVLTAVTVVVSMRIVGLLLISALMIVPNAAAQLFARSFASAMRWASLIGLVAAVGGVVVSYEADTPSGGTIVLLAIGLFLLVAVGVTLRGRVRSRVHASVSRHPHEHGVDCGHPAVAHGDHVDYLHDGHRHAPHEEHYDEHDQRAHQDEHEGGRHLDPAPLGRQGRKGRP